MKDVQLRAEVEEVLGGPDGELLPVTFEGPDGEALQLAANETPEGGWRATLAEFSPSLTALKGARERLFRRILEVTEKPDGERKVRVLGATVQGERWTNAGADGIRRAVAHIRSSRANDQVQEPDV